MLGTHTNSQGTDILQSSVPETLQLVVGSRYLTQCFGNSEVSCQTYLIWPWKCVLCSSGDSNMIAQQGPIMLYSACCTGQVAHQVVSIGIPKKSEASCQFCVVWNIALEKGLPWHFNLSRAFAPISSNQLWRVEGASAMKSKGYHAWGDFVKYSIPVCSKSPGLSEGHHG